MKIILTQKQLLSDYQNKKLGVYYSNKHSYLFPLKASTTLAGLVADITGDGHLGPGLIQFISKYRDEAVRFMKEFNKIFRHKASIRISPSNENTWECIIGTNTLYRVFKLLGAPAGNKTNVKFSIPDWIKNGDDNLRKAYLRRLFDCEGSVSFQKKRRIRIHFELYKNELLKNDLESFLLEMKSILLSFGIKSTNLMLQYRNLRKDGSRSISLSFDINGTKTNLNSVLNFYKNINFESPIKREKLKSYLYELKLPH